MYVLLQLLQLSTSTTVGHVYDLNLNIYDHERQLQFK